MVLFQTLTALTFVQQIAGLILLEVLARRFHEYVRPGLLAAYGSKILELEIQIVNFSCTGDRFGQHISLEWHVQMNRKKSMCAALVFSVIVQRRPVFP